MLWLNAIMGSIWSVYGIGQRGRRSALSAIKKILTLSDFIAATAAWVMLKLDWVPS